MSKKGILVFLKMYVTGKGTKSIKQKYIYIQDDQLRRSSHVLSSLQMNQNFRDKFNSLV